MRIDHLHRLDGHEHRVADNDRILHGSNNRRLDQQLVPGGGFEVFDAMTEPFDERRVLCPVLLEFGDSKPERFHIESHPGGIDLNSFHVGQ